MNYSWTMKDVVKCLEIANLDTPNNSYYNYYSQYWHDQLLLFCNETNRELNYVIGPSIKICCNQSISIIRQSKCTFINPNIDGELKLKGINLIGKCYQCERCYSYNYSWITSVFTLPYDNYHDDTCIWWRISEKTFIDKKSLKLHAYSVALCRNATSTKVRVWGVLNNHYIGKPRGIIWDTIGVFFKFFLYFCKNYLSCFVSSGILYYNGKIFFFF